MRTAGIIVLAVAYRKFVVNAFGFLFDLEVGLNANLAIVKDAIVDATPELWRQLQEPGKSCVCCGTAHVSFVHLNGRNCSYVLFCGMEDLLRFNVLDGLSG